jgi:hypothetical protein
MKSSTSSLLESVGINDWEMPAGILAVADKNLLELLKMECETQFSHKTSAENCLELL